ncbi:MAG TPA: polysaccharide deacetylase [Streptosporangiaceae bacterium]
MALKPPENLARLRTWPGDADVAVALTFDVDAESAWLGEGPEYERRLTTLSQAGYGPVRGLGRILDLLDAHGIKSTFYVPGHTADHYPDSVSEIIERGHEVGHHGYLHRSTDGLDGSRQRDELEQGLEALARLGVRPHGYRSPSWEITPETLVFLGEMGFSYESSMMRDDRPYWVDAGGRPLLELPGHWSLDDWPFLGYTAYHGGLLTDPQSVERIWLEEFASARAEDGRLVTYTMHPEVIGRGYCLRMLERIIVAMRDQGRPWFGTHAEVAALAEPPG